MADRKSVDEVSDRTLREFRFIAAVVGVLGSVLVIGGLVGLTIYPLRARSHLGNGEGLLVALFALGFGLLLLLASTGANLWSRTHHS